MCYNSIVHQDWGETMFQVLDTLDKERVAINPSLKRKSELGQFLTPSSVARYMASLFTKDKLTTPRLLDAGAGIGSLTSAFLERVLNEKTSDCAQVTMVEVDPVLRSKLETTLSPFHDVLDLEQIIVPDDFIEWAVNQLDIEHSLFATQIPRYTHAILNPPYKKINSRSKHRKLLSSIGIETVNLYSAFVALTIELMEQNGEMVAIIPRSFCNGAYFLPFRKLLLGKTAIKHMHLFNSRDKAFKDDDVLQENVILLLERGGVQGDVTISTSQDDSFDDYEEHIYAFDRIVNPFDTQLFIHIPTSNEPSFLEKYPSIRYSLEEIGVEVSTGPVVDFRVRKHLRDLPEEGAVPLLYPNHFNGVFIDWPKQMKNPNAIHVNEVTSKWLYPNGCYVAVKRFSSKEEKRRIVASICRPDNWNYEWIGFENGLNVFHSKKQGIPMELAAGLYLYLSSTDVDQYFRIFNGHTQVNATDLRNMKYPSRELLMKMGRVVISRCGNIDQEEIDRILEEML